MRRDTLYKYISRLMACLLVMVLLFAVVPQAQAEGESGEFDLVLQRRYFDDFRQRRYDRLF